MSDDLRKGGDQMNDQEQYFKAGDEATFKPRNGQPKTGAIGIWSSRKKGVAS